MAWHPTVRAGANAAALRRARPPLIVRGTEGDRSQVAGPAAVDHPTAPCRGAFSGIPLRVSVQGTDAVDARPHYSLTPRLAGLLRYIQAYQVRHGGRTPRLVDMALALGLGAERRSMICRMLGEIEARGHIRKTTLGRRICIEILRPPIVSHTPDGAPLYFIPVKAMPISHGANNA